MRITKIGHSTVLIEAGSTCLLTDPYFGTFGHIAYARVSPPALNRNEIGRLDGVLVSHGHWDHTDRRFFRGLEPDVPVLIPSGTSALMRLKGVRSPVPIRTWKSIRVATTVITAVPATHLARTVGWVVQTGDACIYFAGDTYHQPFMEEIGRRFAIDAALMPVSTYRIPLTMGEKGAVKAARDLRARTVIPIHLGVQPRSPLLRTKQSPEGFERHLRDTELRTRVVHLGDGETWEMSREADSPELAIATAV